MKAFLQIFTGVLLSLYGLSINAEVLLYSSSSFQKQSLNASLNKNAISKIQLNLSVADKLKSNSNVAISLPRGEIIKGVVKRTLEDVRRAKSKGVMETSRKIIALENKAGSLELLFNNNTIISMIHYDNLKGEVYRTDLDEYGRGVMLKEDINTYQCSEYPKVNDKKNIFPALKNTPLALVKVNEYISSTAPDLSTLTNLESKPGATNTLYLNNWGGVLSGTAWNDSKNSGNDINYTPYSNDSDTNTFTENERYLIWLAFRETAEDYAAFDINVTTSKAIYDATPIVNRSQIIATTTQDFYPGAGGVAYVGVFNRSTDYYKTGFTWNGSAGSMGMTHSHEAGHQMGLGHDGTSTSGYYSGHGVWGPIMGAPFGKSYVQWSKGKYADANNSQNDLSVLKNVLGVTPDDVSNTKGQAKNLTFPTNSHKGHISPQGINGENDLDVYSFSLTSAKMMSIKVQSLFSAKGEDRAANLSLYVKLQKANNDTIAVMDPTTITSISPNKNVFLFEGSLEADTYYITVDAISPDSSWTTGFDEYANEGDYEVSIKESTTIIVKTAKDKLTASTGNQFTDTLVVPSGATDINISTSGGTGDVDLYVKFGSLATNSSYDCRPYQTGNEEFCSDTRNNGTYHILLDAYTAYTQVTLTKSYKIDVAGDADSDGLTNGQEVILGTDLLNTDTDGDGKFDGIDTYPLNAKRWTDLDTDGDTITDDIEILLGFNINDANDVWQDDDGDRLPLLLELQENRNQSEKDNDVFSQPRLFVHQAKLDITSKFSSEKDVTDALASLNESSTSPADIYSSLLDETYFGHMGFVGRVYQAVLDRGADLAGARSHYKYLINTQDKLTMVSGFVNSAEFQTTYGHLTNSEFVDLVYVNVLGRAADSGGHANWLDLLDAASITRAQMMLGFIDSDEYIANQDLSSRLTMLHLFFTGSDVTSEMLTAYKSLVVTDSNNLINGSSIVRAILASDGYHNSLMQTPRAVNADTDQDSIPDGVEFTDGTSIEVKDNDVNNNNRLFVKQMLRDLVGEEWSYQVIQTQLTSLTSSDTRADWVKSLLDDPRIKDNRQAISRLYYAAFLRQGDHNGLLSWIKNLENGSSLSSIATAFTNSGEFTARYGDLDNGAFVDLIYQNVLGRVADSGGRSHWVNQLNSGMSRGNMLVGFSESTENRTTHKYRGQTILLFNLLLQRMPSDSDLEAVVNQLKNGTNITDLINTILNSSEYTNRFY